MVGAELNEKNMFKEQAKKDWEKILLSRSKELIDGGRFICINFGIDKEGRYLGNTGAQSMFDNFTFHWKKLLNEGYISNDEFIATTFSQHYRTVEEFRAPFDDPNSLVSQSGLKLKSCSTRITKCPYNNYYLSNKNIMSKSDYAKSLIPTMRSWSETVFKTALINRNEVERDKIVDHFYKSYQDEIANNPEGHAMDYVHIIMDIEKKI